MLRGIVPPETPTAVSTTLTVFKTARGWRITCPSHDHPNRRQKPFTGLTLDFVKRCVEVHIRLEHPELRIVGYASTASGIRSVST